MGGWAGSELVVGHGEESVGSVSGTLPHNTAKSQRLKSTGLGGLHADKTSLSQFKEKL